MTHADHVRRLGVHANADTGADAARARRFGATGVGLCRTEHMFLGDRRVLVERLILAADDTERDGGAGGAAAVAAGRLRRAVRGDGRPAGDHPADRPAAARVPARRWRSWPPGSPAPRRSARTRAATARCWPRCAGCTSRTRCSACAAYGSAWSIPGLFAMQVRAIAEAAAARVAAGGDPRPEIMVPLVGAVQELETVRAEAEAVLAVRRRARRRSGSAP